MEAGEMVKDKSQMKQEKFRITCSQFHMNGYNKVTYKLPMPLT